MAVTEQEGVSVGGRSRGGYDGGGYTCRSIHISNIDLVAQRCGLVWWYDYSTQLTCTVRSNAVVNILPNTVKREQEL